MHAFRRFYYLVATERIALVMLLCILPLYANWGGYTKGSSGAGDLFKSDGFDQIKMVSESLFIDLYGTHANVTVRYEMLNTSGQVSVSAGFPCFVCYGCSKKSGRSKDNGFDVFDYTISADGSLVNHTRSEGEIVKWFRNEDKMESLPPGELSPNQVFWLLSEIPFREKQSRKISISYKNYYYSQGGGYTDWHTTFDADLLRYFLHTGESWKGAIGSGYVRIRVLGTDPARVVIRPEKRFTRFDSTFVWEFRDLEPTLKDNIEVCLMNGGEVIECITGKNDQIEAWYLLCDDNRFYFDQHMYTATASSCGNSEKYVAANIADFDEATAWVEGVKGSGIGESLMLEMKFPVDIKYVGIMGGYFKSKETYYSNNRVAKIKIVVNNTHSREYALYDEYHELPATDHRSYQFLELPPSDKPVKKLTLTITGVYKGDKYDETCISEVLLRKKLTERPSF